MSVKSKMVDNELDINEDLEKRNFLLWYSVTDNAEISMSSYKYCDKYLLLCEKYAMQIEQIERAREFIKSIRFDKLFTIANIIMGKIVNG